MSAKHTPTPWAMVAHSWEETSVIQTGSGKTVCALRIDGLVDEDTQDHYEAIMKEDAAFIVKACNNHDALVAAIHKLRYAVTRRSNEREALEESSAVLAKVSP